MNKELPCPKPREWIMPGYIFLIVERFLTMESERKKKSSPDVFPGISDRFVILIKYTNYIAY